MNRPKSAVQRRSPPRTDDPATIKTLAGILKMSQTEAVDDFLEESCWSNSFPELVGHKGTAAQRLAALRDAYQKEIAERRNWKDISITTS